MTARGWAMSRFQSRRTFLGLLAGASAAAVALPSVAMTVRVQSDVTLNLYNSQHVTLAEAWAADFTSMTGIKVAIRSASDFVLANQIVQEGDASPADVYITENSPAMTIVGNNGLFA